MFIANDSNYTFGKFLAVLTGDDIKAPVYSKCFTDTEALKGYRFIHDPEETDPEKSVCYSIYDDVSSEATSTTFMQNASVSDLTSVSFRLDTIILDTGKVRDVPYYHVIVPVQNIKDNTLKYLVIKMTKEVELFPENYPYYELVSTFADAEPTSAEAPGSVTPTGTITITENDTYNVTNYASAAVNVPGITPTGTLQITENDTYDVTNYASAAVNVSSDYSTCTVDLINSTEGEVPTAVANIIVQNNVEMTAGIAEFTSETSEQEKTIVLYKGTALLRLVSPGNLVATGDIQILSAPGAGSIGALITGNGTITHSPGQE